MTISADPFSASPASACCRAQDCGVEAIVNHSDWKTGAF